MHRRRRSSSRMWREYVAVRVVENSLYVSTYTTSGARFARFLAHHLAERLARRCRRLVRRRASAAPSQNTVRCVRRRRGGPSSARPSSRYVGFPVGDAVVVRVVRVDDRRVVRADDEHDGVGIVLRHLLGGVLVPVADVVAPRARSTPCSRCASRRRRSRPRPVAERGPERAGERVAADPEPQRVGVVERDGGAVFGRGGSGRRGRVRCRRRAPTPDSAAGASVGVARVASSAKPAAAHAATDDHDDRDDDARRGGRRRRRRGAARRLCASGSDVVGGVAVESSRSRRCVAIAYVGASRPASASSRGSSSSPLGVGRAGCGTARRRGRRERAARCASRSRRCGRRRPRRCGRRRRSSTAGARSRSRCGRAAPRRTRAGSRAPTRSRGATSPRRGSRSRGPSAAARAIARRCFSPPDMR